MRKLIAILFSVLFLFSLCPVSAEVTEVLLKNAAIIGEVGYSEVEGKNCVFLESLGDTLAIRAATSIAADTANLALRIVYLDKGSNYIWVDWNLQGSGTRNRLIHKSNSGELREAIVLINQGLYNGSGKNGEDIRIYGYDTRNGRYSEYIHEIELIDLDSLGFNEENGKKQTLLYKSSADLLKKIELLPNEILENEASVSDINTYFEQITGMKGTVTEGTMRNVLTNWLATLGYSTSGNLKNRATEAGLIRNVDYAPAFYGFESGRSMQNFGIASITLNLEQKVFYDDLAGLLYNLLFMKPATDGEVFLVTLAKNDAAFKEKLLNTNDYFFANTYHHNAGIEISERAVTDSITGETIIQLFMKGGNVNSTYVNEFSSVDGENYLLCAAFDKRQGIGVPVIYNRTTKQTVELSRRGGIIQFAMAMSKQNIAYWTEGASLYSYNIQTKETKTVFTDPDGARLQDIPTITNDGKYVTVFSGKTVSYQPDTVYRINTETGEYQALIESTWVQEHFGGSENPHVGHIIINPEDPELVNFLHGGGTNVTDRIWVYDHGEIYQPYIQQMKTGHPDYFGEHITHAFWSTDGKRLYFLRPPASSDSVDNGITYLDMTEAGQLRTAHVLNGDYSYIHTSVDEGDKHFISDTQIVYDNGQFRNEIVFYSDVAKKSYLLAYVPIWNSHPCHSHPTFTADWKKVVFNMIDEKTENCLVAVMEIEKIAQQLDSDAYDAKDRIAWLSGGKSSGLRPILPNRDTVVKLSGEECIMVSDTSAESTASLNIEVFGSIVPENENTVTVYVTYFDDGEGAFYLQYNTNSDSEYDKPKNKKQLLIPKTNSKTWKTQVLTLVDASFRSANADNTDFMILPADLETVYIKNIAVFTGTQEKAVYSAPEKIDGSYYLPIINPEQNSEAVLAIADTGEIYTGQITGVSQNSLIVIPLLTDTYQKLFVWRENLQPLTRRGNLYLPLGFQIAAPKNVTVNPDTVTNSTVDVTWTAPEDGHWLQYYNVYRNGEFAGITNGAETVFRDVGIPHHTTVSYTVAAVDITGKEGERSECSVSVTTDDIARLWFGAAADAIAEGTTSVQLSATDSDKIHGYNINPVTMITGEVTANSGNSYSTSIEAVNQHYNYETNEELGLHALKFNPNMSRVLASIPEGEFLDALKAEEQDELKLVMNYFDYQANDPHTYVDATGKNFSNMIRYGYTSQLNGTTGVNAGNSQKWNTRILTVPTSNNTKDGFIANSSNLYPDVFRDRPFQYKNVNSTGTKTAATNGIDAMFGIGNSSGNNPVYLSKIEIGMKDYVPYGAVLDFDKQEDTQFVRFLRRNAYNQGQLVTAEATATGEFKTAIELDSSHSYNRLLRFGFSDSYLTPTDRNVILRITYLDNHNDETDSQGLTVAYDSTSGKKAAKILHRTGTNTWKTATFMIDNAAFSDADGSLQLGTVANHEYDWYISRVEVIKR